MSTNIVRYDSSHIKLAISCSTMVESINIPKMTKVIFAGDGDFSKMQ